MSKHFFAAAFAVGLLVVGWVALGFAGSGRLALVVTAAIAAVYLLGAWELHQFRAASAGLSAALAAIPDPLPPPQQWLDGVPPALRGAVRLRIEEERGVLPGPALTPYLVGLLVMLGMLGTFLGMIVTFQGTVFALEGSADLQAMRSALAEPIKGLGLSFGTSVAGVAASAMLGLMSALSRRERLEVARQLDHCIATALRPLSLSQQRREAFRALQAQAGALPAVVDPLDAMMERIEARGRQLDEQLLARQSEFQREAALAYTGLARAVGAALQDSLAAGAQAAGASITPVVESAMARIVQEARQLHAQLGEAARAQGEALSQRFGATQERNLQAWTQMLAGAEELVRARTASESHWLEQHGQRMDQLAQTWRAQLEALRQQEQLRGEAAAARLAQLQLEWRQQASSLAGREDEALRERAGLLDQVGALLHSVGAAAGEQRAAVETLVARASGVLEQAAARFDQVLQAHAGQAAEASAHVAASSIELASVGEAFGQGMQLFQAANDRAMATLQRVEAALARSTARSDEQLAYYVAQAREVIDLSIASQQGLVEQLRLVQGAPA